MLTLDHKKFQVYQVAVKMVKEIYKLTNGFPSDERFGLVSQLRRAAISVCNNIAEGAARKLGADRKRFYEISRSSSVEIDTQLEIAYLLGYIKCDQTNDLQNYLESIFKMLSKMIESTN